LPDPFSLSRVEKVDTRHVHTTYEKWPALARDGFRTQVEIPQAGFTKAYVLGMGGSAAGGDIVAGWLANRPEVEMAVFKGQLPIGDLSDALAIACSASGETQETIEMMKTAVSRGATTISISNGGKLMEVSKELRIPHIMTPELVAPRYMLPFIIFACLSIANRGLGLECETEAADAISQMVRESNEIGLGTPTGSNPSKRLAVRLVRGTAAIYGARVTRGVGIRFKNVLNENSKVHALFDGIPDVFHNEIEAWEDRRSDFIPIFLRHSNESDRDRLREDRMFEILSKSGKRPIQINGRGGSSLAQLVTMVYRLDMASYYLALALGRDPFPTRLIDRLKR